MNDFTKDELALLYEAINYMLDENIFITQKSKELGNKIKSLIDNYCEHKDFSIHHHIKTYVCDKCGKAEV